MPSSKVLDPWKIALANSFDSGEKPLAAALELMNNEGVTSLPVLDQHQNVIGNISHVDVRVSGTSTLSILNNTNQSHL
jgi:predicted transcriptional regulator